MAASAIAQYQKKRIIVYNSDGTVNLRLTAMAGPHIRDATARASSLLLNINVRPGVSVHVGITNMVPHQQEPVVLWDGVEATYNGLKLFTIQFAYQGGTAFPVKAIELGGKEIFFGRNWVSFRKYLSSLVVEVLDVQG